ncbi:NADP-dependent oxidoreductase domain-containing protein [Suillus placidus]|uniref:NADP-dependent oxidoreductase domain-containing protein n=1 Tax=Suillus placidus TaxID=48579 RepID=A0A9P7D2E9_9AGAM|nr:NADP-dependent oxidoreductase domain-containing protein [Suillus placidus]
MTTRIPLIYGTLAARIHDLSECQKSVDCFVGKWIRVIDTVRNYGDGTSEEYLSQLDIKGAAIDTKSVSRLCLQASLTALAPYKIRVFFLHVPDRSVSYDEMLRGVNELYEEGLFEEFGLSNFYSWEVSEIVTIAKSNGWIKPTVHQGLYNALERNVESELFPCLRKFGIRFHWYSPLARGLLAGTSIASPTPGSCWDIESSVMAAGLRESLAKHNISGGEAAFRWLQHHSMLEPHDAIIIGASNVSQLEQNIRNWSEIVSFLDGTWTNYKGRAPPYCR